MALWVYDIDSKELIARKELCDFTCLVKPLQLAPVENAQMKLILNDCKFNGRPQ